jgi:quinol monooxygenase YgiN
MIVGIGDVFVQVPHRRAAERTMLAAQAAARQQHGCLSFSFAEVIDDPGHFVIVQRWSDRESLESHYRSDSFAGYQNAIEPLLVRDSALELHVVQETLRPVEVSNLDIRQDD